LFWGEGAQQSCVPLFAANRPKRPPGRYAARATAALPTGALLREIHPPQLVTPGLSRGPTLLNGIQPLLRVGCRDKPGMTINGNGTLVRQLCLRDGPGLKN